MRPLEELEAIGYAIHLEGDRIRVKYQGDGKPDPSRVKPLMAILKDHKAEALAALRQRETDRIFLEAVHELSAAWAPGLLAHTERHHPNIMALIRQAEEALEKTWAKTLEGAMSLSDYEEAVGVWKDAYKLTIHSRKRRSHEQ